jgi:hypothetical protein
MLTEKVLLLPHKTTSMPISLNTVLDAKYKKHHLHFYAWKTTFFKLLKNENKTPARHYVQYKVKEAIHTI